MSEVHMMRLAFNRTVITISASVAMVFISVMIISGNSYAVTGVLDRSAAKTSNQFCANLATETAKVTEKMTSLSEKLSQAWTTQDTQVASKLKQIDTDVTARREQAETNLNSNFAKLEAKAITDAQKQAVQDYETVIKTAVSIRRAAYDTARQTFRDAVKEQVALRRSIVLGQQDTFKSSVDSAIIAAKATCLDDGTSSTARTTYQTAMKAARDAFQNSRTEDNSIKNRVQEFATTRNSTFESANQAFKASLESAKLTLQQAFGEDKASI